jgi:predicted DNA-binding helix-hairpin-helix protein
MTHVNHVVYKKVQGYLMVVSTPEEQHNAISNTKEFNGSYPVPCVFYSPYKPTEGIDPVCIPFQAVSSTSTLMQKPIS